MKATNNQHDQKSTSTQQTFPYTQYIIICTITSILVFLIAIVAIDDDHESRDATENKRLAFNLAKHGVFSLSFDDTPDVEPSLEREPLYPAYLAVVLRLFTDIDEMTYECLSPEGECVSVRLLLNRASIPLYISLVWLFTAAAYRIIGNWWIVGTGLIMLFSVNHFLYHVTFTELPAALFLLMHAFFLYMSASGDAMSSRRRYLYALLSGIGLGALILTKAIFLYWLPILAVGVIAFYVWRLSRNESKTYAHIFLLLLASVLFVTPWLVRNYVLFDEVKIAGRDGAVLALRAEYSYLTGREYLGGMAHFSTPQIRRFLLPLFDEQDYYRMQREIDGVPNEESYRYLALNRTGRVAERAMEMYGSTDDEAISAAAWSVIRENWQQHLALTFFFAWRGSFIDTAEFASGGFYHHPVDLGPLNIMHGRYRVLIGLMMSVAVPCMLAVVIGSLWKRHWALLLLFLPVLYSFGIHAFITHYIPRYSSPLVPIWLIGMGLVAKYVIDHIFVRLQNGNSVKASY